MKRSHAKTAPDAAPPIAAIATQAGWDNEQLVTRALAGDPVAENAIYRQHVRYLLNLATRLTRSVGDGDDAVQDTFVVAFQKLHRLENPEALRLWLTRILVSRVKKSLRARRLRAFFGFVPIGEDATLEMCARHGARPDLRSELREIDDLLLGLPSKWRTTWMLHRIEGLTIYETAAATTHSVATVKRYVAAVDSAVRSNLRLAP